MVSAYYSHPVVTFPTLFQSVGISTSQGKLLTIVIDVTHQTEHLHLLIDGTMEVLITSVNYLECMT